MNCWHDKNFKLVKSAPKDGILSPSLTEVTFDIKLGRNQAKRPQEAPFISKLVEDKDSQSFLSQLETFEANGRSTRSKVTLIKFKEMPCTIGNHPPPECGLSSSLSSLGVQRAAHPTVGFRGNAPETQNNQRRRTNRSIQQVNSQLASTIDEQHNNWTKSQALSLLTSQSRAKRCLPYLKISSQSKVNLSLNTR